MAFEEAYKIEAERVKLNENTFTEGMALETALDSKIDEVQERLEEMLTVMADDSSIDKLEAASHAIKKELTDSIPDNFRNEYELAKDGGEASASVSQHILEGANDFIADKLKDKNL